MKSFYFDTVDSTNEAAKRMIRGGEIQAPAFLMAREQTAGRGSRGRDWVSPRDAGIYLSVVELPVPPVVASTDTGEFTLAAGVACVEIIAETTGVDVRLKPVNDLYVERAKLGGILTECMIESGRVHALITGLGINLRRAERPLVDAHAPAVSLEECMSPEAFAALDGEALAASLVVRVRAMNALVIAGRSSEVRTRWNRYRMTGASLPD